MHFVRAVDRRRFLVGLALGGLGLAAGCGGSSNTSAPPVVEAPEVVKKRENMIQDYYKANPQKGPRGAARKQ